MSVDFGQAARYRAELDTRKLALLQELFQLCAEQNEYAPISLLPPEILTEIFLICRGFRNIPYPSCCDDDDESADDLDVSRNVEKDLKKNHQPCRPFGYCSEDAMLYLLSQVCKSWRAFIRNTPIFWDTVYLHQPLFLLKSKVALTVIARDSGRLCCGTGYEPPFLENPSRTINWLLETCPRIKTFDLALPMDILKDVFAQLSSHPSQFFFTTRCHINDPVAHEDSLDWGDSASYRPMTHMPLSHLLLSDVPPPPWLDSTSLSNLRVLEVQLPALTITNLLGLRDILMACSVSLETLRIDLEAAKHLDPHITRSLADNVPLQPLIHLPNLRSFHIGKRCGYLMHRFLSMMDAPHSQCNASFNSLSYLWEYFHEKPMTSEWGSAIGDYMVRYSPSGTIIVNHLSEMSDRPHRLSTYHPYIHLDTFASDGGTGSWRTASIGRLTDVFQGFVNITSFVLYIVSFNTVFAGKEYNEDKGEVQHAFLEEYSRMENEDSPEARAIMELREDRTSEELVGLLTSLPQLKELRLLGLTGKKEDDRYLGSVLAVPTFSDENPGVLCPRLGSLALIYTHPPFCCNKELYLPWLYHVLATRQNASTKSEVVRGIESVEIVVHTNCYRTRDKLEPEETKLLHKIGDQVKEMENRLSSSGKNIFDMFLQDRSKVGKWRLDPPA